MKNVLIITYNFSPNNSISSHRFNDLCYYMRQFGYEPWIVTTNSTGSLKSLVPEENIIRIGSNHKINSHKSESFSGVVSLIRNKIMGLKLRSMVVDYSIPWYINVVRQKRTIKREVPHVDVIIGTYGPIAPFLIARYLSSQYKAPWVADYRDLCSLSKREFSSLTLNSIDRILERKLVKSAKIFTTVSETLSHTLKQEYNKESFVIYNGWNETLSMSEPATDCKKYIYYAGRFYNHRMDSLFLLIENIKSYPELKIKIRSLGPDNLDERIVDFAKSIDAFNQVELLSPVDHETVMRESVSSICNLVLENLVCKETHQLGVLTGKFLQHLPLTPPILAIADANSEIGAILKRTGKGQLCSNQHDLNVFLNKITSKKEEFTDIDDAGIRFFSKENQARFLCEILDKYI